MGCFQACFGLSKKRKRPKRLYKVIAADQVVVQFKQLGFSFILQKYGNSEALHSSLTVNHGITENPIVPFSEFRGREKCKEQTSGKNRKRVRFNLNVQIYEPNLTAYQILDNEEEESDNNNAATEGSAALTMTYPSNYRYYNYREGFDDEDEITNEESDIEAYDDTDEFNDSHGDSDGGEDKKEFEACNQITRQKEFLELYSLVAEERIKNQLPLAPNDAEMKSNLSGQNRSMCTHSVMSPVENLTQWKAIKAKVTPSNRHGRKQNVPPEQKKSKPLVSKTSLNFSPFRSESNVHHSKPLLPEIAVDASLSNWLVSPNSNAL
ncbi:hypothetical protein E2542_SST25224 [Spatholobus suberectus]|nr:hypothetical protein E2542_SST25224 [Spatholobus suberectus]